MDRNLLSIHTDGLRSRHQRNRCCDAGNLQEVSSRKACRFVISHVSPRSEVWGFHLGRPSLFQRRFSVNTECNGYCARPKFGLKVFRCRDKGLREPAVTDQATRDSYLARSNAWFSHHRASRKSASELISNTNHFAPGVLLSRSMRGSFFARSASSGGIGAMRNISEFGVLIPRVAGRAAKIFLLR